MSLLSYFSPTVFQLTGLLSVLVLVFGFAHLGALASPKNRFDCVDIFTGWGLATGFLTVLGVVFTQPFVWATLVLLGGMVIAIFIHYRHKTGAPSLGLVIRVFVLSLPLLILVSAMKASQWDEFSQWLPNAIYLFRFDGFPSNALPASPSVFPAYPHAGPLMVYMVSRMARGFVENAGAISNIVMVLALAPVYLHMVGQGLKLKKPVSGSLSRWGWAALGVLGVTALSTSFVQKLIFTAYADTPTAVALAVLGVLVWKIQEKLSGAEGKISTNTYAWQFSMVSVLFINLKQTNVVLFVFLLAASLIVALRDPKIRLLDYLKRWPLMLAAPIVVYLAWRYHVSVNLAGREFSLQPYDKWLLPQAFQILNQMLLVATKKGAYFVMMLGISLSGLWALIRFKGAYGRMAMLTGAMFVSYNVFLWAMYIAAFGSYEGPRAAGLWRYNTQLALMGAVTMGFGIASLYRHWKQGSFPAVWAKITSVLVIVLVLLMPAATRTHLRFDFRAQKDHMRNVGQELGQTLSSGSKVGIVDPRGNGYSSVVMFYELMNAPDVKRGLASRYKFRVSGRPTEDVVNEINDQKITHIWVFQTTPAVNKAVGMVLNPLASHLLKWTGSGWEKIKSWDYIGFTDPTTMPD